MPCTPGVRASSAFNRWKNVTRLCASEYAVAGSTRPNVVSRVRLKPASTVIRFQKLRSMSPAPITRTTASATSALTSVLRMRARPLPAVERCPASFSVMLTACCRRLMSGAMPNRSPVTTDTTSVKSSTIGSSVMSADRGTPSGSAASRARSAK